ncbi:hypothetical protein [Lagierella sp.]|uniref:hypothetical protein n=1 Tax=Lagierella sp. TaxID=2849657 RepID=UPI00261D5A19|nr:hypothetical protein [Lagierella sp.]
MLDRILNRQIETSNLTHAYLFQSYDDELLESQTLKFLKIILKDDSKEDSIEEYYNPDLLKINPEGTAIRIDSIREAIRFLQTPPTVNEHKIILIRKGEKFNKESANALLKVLEEPPKYGIIIIETNNEMSIIQTIYSRCQIINFFPDKQDKLNPWKEINEILLRCFKRDLLVIFDKRDYLGGLKDDVDKLYNYFYCFFYDLYLYGTEPKKEDALFIPDNYNIYRNTEVFSREDIYLILEKISEIWNNFKTNTNFQLSYEELLLYIMEEQNG